MFKKLFLAVCFFIISLSLGFTQDAKLEFEGRYWITDLDAKAKVDAAGVGGTTFDLKSDLGIQDEDFPEGRVTLNLGSAKWRFAYMQVNYSGNQNISQTITFKGQPYTLGTNVTSDFDLVYLRFGRIWNLFDWGEKTKIGAVIETKGILANVQLDAPALPLSESEEIIGGLPTLGVAIEINPIKKINLFAEISGLGAGGYGYFFDAEAGIKLIPFKNFSVIGGFRIIDLKLEYDDNLVEVKATGPFLGATLRF